jgi:hypothetical protein
VAAPAHSESQPEPTAPIVAAEQAAVAEAPQPQWNLATRIAFRFAFAYFLLYNLPCPGHSNILGYIPGSSFVTQPYIRMWRAFVPWIATRILGLSGPSTVYPAVNGSGDSTLDWIQNGTFVAFAAFATIVWSILDRKRPNYDRLHYWLRVGVRYTLAVTLFSYGFAKVFPLQFRPPAFARLLEPWGEFSPMGALWSFMGASIPYIMFSGAAEVLGGLLVIPRRTVTLGALVSAAVMTNVFALNMFYDVPVKLYSFNILLMALFLAAPDFPRLARVFVLHKPAPPGNLEGLQFGWKFGVKKYRIAAFALKTILFGYILYNSVSGGFRSISRVNNPTLPPLYGLWEVEGFARRGVEVAPLVTDGTRWRKVALQSMQGATVRMMDDAVRNYQVKYDAAGSALDLTGPADAGHYTWIKPDNDHIVLASAGATIKLRRIDATKFLLVDRGFRWINERPFNR